MVEIKLWRSLTAVLRPILDDLPQKFLPLETAVSLLPAILSFWFFAPCALALGGQAASAPKTVSLKDEVLALLQSRCVKCHGPQKPKAELNLVSLEGMARGSTNGPVVHPGKPDQSTLWQMIQEGKMPPKSPLPEAERSLVRRWITQGAPGLPLAKAESPSAHWAFRPPAPGAMPAVRPAKPTRTALHRDLNAAPAKNKPILS